MRRPVAVRVVGPMEWIVYPTLAVIVVTVVLATPVRLFGLRLPQPLLALVLAFAWPLVRPSMLAPLVLFALGLFLDLLWGGTPLGMWPLSLMSVYGIILLSRNLLAGQDTLVMFGIYVLCTLLALMLPYLIVTFDNGNPPSLVALIWQVVPTLLLFPVANGMLERFDDGDTRFR